MADLDDELMESHLVLFESYQRSGPQPQMLMFVDDDEDVHAVMCLTVEAMHEVINLGVSAWPRTNRVVLNGGKLPMTTLVSSDFSGAITGVPNTSWRGRVKSWEHVRADADSRIVLRIREALAGSRSKPAKALARIEALDGAFVMPA